MKPDIFSTEDIARMEREGISEDDLRRMKASPIVPCKKCATPLRTVSRWLIFHEFCECKAS